MEYEIGKRYPFTKKDYSSFVRAVGTGVIICGKPDLTRGRVFDKKPGDWHFWNTEGKKVNFSISQYAIIASAEKEVDPNIPEPL